MSDTYSRLEQTAKQAYDDLIRLPRRLQPSWFRQQYTDCLERYNVHMSIDLRCFDERGHEGDHWQVANGKKIYWHTNE